MGSLKFVYVGGGGAFIRYGAFNREVVSDSHTVR